MAGETARPGDLLRKQERKTVIPRRFSEEPLKSRGGAIPSPRIIEWTTKGEAKQWHQHL
jgi:hypothetical protein